MSAIDDQHIAGLHRVNRLHLELVGLCRNGIHGFSPRGENPSAESIGRGQSPYFRAQALVAQPDPVHHVGHDGGIQYRQSGDRIRFFR